MRLWTAGYSGRSPAGLIETFKQHRIGLVVDVRLSPASREARWNRAELAPVVETAGMRYQWSQALGNPFYPRGRSVTVAQGEEILRRFRDHLATDPRAAGALMGLELAITSPKTPPGEPAGVVLLCLCRSASRCHRGPIVEALRRRLPALEVTHL